MPPNTALQPTRFAALRVRLNVTFYVIRPFLTYNPKVVGSNPAPATNTFPKNHHGQAALFFNASQEN
jgi:hypothetical protein